MVQIKADRWCEGLAPPFLVPSLEANSTISIWLRGGAGLPLHYSILGPDQAVMGAAHRDSTTARVNEMHVELMTAQMTPGGTSTKIRGEGGFLRQQKSC